MSSNEHLRSAVFRRTVQPLMRDGLCMVSSAIEQTVFQRTFTKPWDMIKERRDSEMVYRGRSILDGAIRTATFGKLQVIKDEERKRKMARDAFRVMDVDKVGYLSYEQTAALLCSLDFQFTQESLTDVLFVLDPSRKGRILLSAFVRFWAEFCHVNRSGAYPIDKPMAVPVHDAQFEYSSIYREANHSSELIGSQVNNCRTLFESLRYSAYSYPLHRCYGVRGTDSLGHPGRYEWLTYRQVYFRALNFGCGLKGLCHVKKGGLVGIYMSTRLEWMVSFWANQAFGLATLPLYLRAGHLEIASIIRDTNVEVIITEDTSLQLFDDYWEHIPSLKYIVTVNTGKRSSTTLDIPGVMIVSFEYIENYGISFPIRADPPAPDDTAVILYTSGTTGGSKGVVHTHRGFISCMSAILCGRVNISDKDSFLSFLSLAHIMELFVHTVLTHRGVAIGFFRGKGKEGIFEDMRELKPTLLITVPLILNRMHTELLTIIRAHPVWQRIIFGLALKEKLKNLKHGDYTHTLWDRIVFPHLREWFGGNIRLIITGSSAIQYDILDFLRVVLSCQVQEAFGLTEALVTNITDVNDYSCTSVGAPLPCVEMKLWNDKAMGYFVHHKPPRGEVCFRGENIMAGYLEHGNVHDGRDKSGFLHTGDIGELQPNGTLRIIDRKLSIFKLSSGFTITPESLEEMYRKIPVIEDIFIHGSHQRTYFLAVVVCNKEAVMAWAKTQDIFGGKAYKRVLTHDRLRDWVLQEINEFAAARDIPPYKVPAQIVISAAKFHELGLVSKLGRIRRFDAADNFMPLFRNIYDSLDH